MRGHESEDGRPRMEDGGSTREDAATPGAERCVPPIPDPGSSRKLVPQVVRELFGKGTRVREDHRGPIADDRGFQPRKSRR